MKWREPSLLSFHSVHAICFSAEQERVADLHSVTTLERRMFFFRDAKMELRMRVMSRALHHGEHPSPFFHSFSRARSEGLEHGMQQTNGRG